MHVLVHVRTGIPFILLHCTAILIDDVCVAYKRDMHIFARACDTLQNPKNQTQNPPIARSWGFDPPSRHQISSFRINQIQPRFSLVPRMCPKRRGRCHSNGRTVCECETADSQSGRYADLSNAARTMLRAWSRTDLSSSAETSANPSPRSRKIPSTANSA